MEKTGESSDHYGIGAVVGRTGLSAPGIRMWEKRYGAVIPERTASNRRLYCAEDVERLVLMKKLTSRGEAIRNIAHLDLDQLRDRVAQDDAERGTAADGGETRPPSRLLAVGPGLGSLLRDREILEAELVGRFDEVPAAAAAADLPPADLLLVGTETLFPETIAAVRELVKRTRASRTILIFHFTSAKTVKSLATGIDGMSLLQAPLDDNQLRRECLVQLNAVRPRESPDPLGDPGPIPERLYDQDQLARLARVSSAVECECPQHLAGLLQSLSAFEKYSRECEDRNPQDALLHAYLHRTTATVRRTMEEALRHLVRVEGIAID